MFEIRSRDGSISNTMAIRVREKSGAMEEADFVAIHPSQIQKILDCYVTVKIENYQEVKGTALDPALKDYPMTFVGLRLVQDPHMVKDEIHFRDKDNRIIGKIVGLATP